MVEKNSLDEGLESETFGETSGMLRFQGTNEAEDESSEASEEETSEDETSEEESDEEEEYDEEEESAEKELFGETKIPKELEGLKKRLLGSYTKKMMGLTPLRMKAEIVDEIEKNPKESILALARQYGVELPAGKADEEIDLSKLEIPEPVKDETMSTYLKRALTPLFGQLSKSLASSVKGAVERVSAKTTLDTEKIRAQERVQRTLGWLNENHPDWGLYEEEMLKVLKVHPTLKDDPETLYEMGKAHYLKGVRASTKKGLTGTSTKVSTGERGSKVVQTSLKGRKLSFNEAWERARRDISRKG